MPRSTTSMSRESPSTSSETDHHSITLQLSSPALFSPLPLFSSFSLSHRTHVTSRAPLQVIVISLKDTFYTKADTLVGVFKDQERGASGKLELDLTKYD